MQILCIMGTRPEAIKMAPVIKELQRHQGVLTPVVCVTAQHQEMLDQVLSLFDIRPDIDLEVIRENQSLADLTALVLTGFDAALHTEKPDWVLVQGDTTAPMAATQILKASNRGTLFSTIMICRPA